MKKVLFILSFALLAYTCASAKTVAIFGDSYSTFENCIPEGYRTWYGPSRTDIDTDVTCADSTWWSIFCRDKGYELILNSSYSGSCVCNTQQDSINSYVSRVKRDLNAAPDLILIFGGTNDCWNGVPVGDVLPPWKCDTANLFESVPAMCNIIGYLKVFFPQAQVVIMNNCDICAELIDRFAIIASLYRVDCVQLYGIDKTAGHPTKLGMRQIAAQLENVPGI